jgi:hypothetical protein
MDELNDAAGCRQKELPFIKRIGYRDEREWRILATSDNRRKFFEVPFDLDWIHRIILSPWMTSDDAEIVRKQVRSLVPASVEINRSFLTNSKRWQKLGRSLSR